jgi:hypothetical protein
MRWFLLKHGETRLRTQNTTFFFLKHMYKESAVNKGMFMHYEQNIKLQVQKYFFIQSVSSVVANLDHVLHRRLTRNKIFKF